MRLKRQLEIDERRRRVLVTGAAGRIGSAFAAHAASRLELRLADRADADLRRLEGLGEVVPLALADLDGLRSACAGIDTVVHLGGDPHPDASWQSVLENNIEGTFNAMTAAADTGCRRFVYASSVHAVAGYPPGRQVRSDDPVNPANLYGVSKTFGEALGRYIAEQRGVSVIALRIGAYVGPDEADRPASPEVGDSFVAARDLFQLIERSIHVENVRFAILGATSDNATKRLDLVPAVDLLGYAPQDGFRAPAG